MQPTEVADEGIPEARGERADAKHAESSTSSRGATQLRIRLELPRSRATHTIVTVWRANFAIHQLAIGAVSTVRSRSTFTVLYRFYNSVTTCARVVCDRSTFICNGSFHDSAHFLLAELSVELKNIVQCAIPVIHDSTSTPLTVLEGMSTSEVVANLMGKGLPRAGRVPRDTDVGIHIPIAALFHVAQDSHVR